MQPPDNHRPTTPSEAERDLRPWHYGGLVALLVIILSVPLYSWRVQNQQSRASAASAPVATFVGRNKCIACHKQAYDKWRGSHHDRSMDVATEETVAATWDGEFEHEDITARFFTTDGKFMVRTEGPGGGDSRDAGGSGRRSR